MSQAPVSVSIFIGDIPEEDTTAIFDFMRQLGSNFSFTVSDPLVIEDEDILPQSATVMTVKELADAYEAALSTNVVDVIQDIIEEHFEELQEEHFPESTTCPKCILPKGHTKECGPGWMPTDNR